MLKRKFSELDDNEEGNSLPDSTTPNNETVQISLISDDDDDKDDELGSEDGDDDDNPEKKDTYTLKENDFEGQEEGTGGIDGDIQLTPFNMKEELEDGHFDSDGMYHWKKEGKLARDNWLENIDWIKVNKTKTAAVGKESSDVASVPKPFDEIQVYRKMIMMMKPKETVARSLRRIAGNKNVTTSERWKRKRAGLNPTEQEQQARENITKFTELADSILQNTGNMDVYQETYEFISNKVTRAATSTSVSGAPMASSTKDAELDMYADDFDEKEKERLDVASNSQETSGPQDNMWEFKWNKDSEIITGPHTTSQMNEWFNSNHFIGEVWVRKCGVDGGFHSSKRIDFEIYM